MRYVDISTVIKQNGERVELGTDPLGSLLFERSERLNNTEFRPYQAVSYDNLITIDADDIKSVVDEKDIEYSLEEFIQELDDPSQWEVWNFGDNAPVYIRDEYLTTEMTIYKKEDGNFHIVTDFQDEGEIDNIWNYSFYDRNDVVEAVEEFFSEDDLYINNEKSDYEEVEKLFEVEK